MNNTFQDIDGLGFSMGASPDGIGYAPMAGPFGADMSQPIVTDTSTGLKRTLVAVHAVASLAGGALGAYHGYKRNDSVGWAIGWAFLGSLFPYITVPVALAQGVGKRKGR